MLTQAMAKAFAPEVSVNCVAPGWIELGEQAPRDSRRPRICGQYADAAQWDGGGRGPGGAVFRTGPQFVTGQILAVDGGLGIS